MLLQKYQNIARMKNYPRLGCQIESESGNLQELVSQLGQIIDSFRKDVAATEERTAVGKIHYSPKKKKRRRC